MRTPRRGFTLIELLVVIAIIAVLVALLLPAIQHVREAARKTQCRNRLHNIGIALHNYHGSHGQFPPGWIGATGGRHDFFGNNGFGWAAQLLPYMEQKNLQDRLDFNQSILATTNQPHIRLPIETFNCPSDQKPETWVIQSEDSANTNLATLATSNYVGVFGTTELHDCEEQYETDGIGFQCKGNGTFFHNSDISIGDMLIGDGSSTTIVIGERRTNPQNAWYSTWAGVVPEGEHAAERILGHAEHAPNANVHVEDFSSWHSGGAMFLFGDGAARFLSDNLDVNIFRGMATVNGGEVVQLP